MTAGKIWRLLSSRLNGLVIESRRRRKKAAKCLPGRAENKYPCDAEQRTLSGRIISASVSQHRSQPPSFSRPCDSNLSHLIPGRGYTNTLLRPPAAFRAAHRQLTSEAAAETASLKRNAVCACERSYNQVSGLGCRLK